MVQLCAEDHRIDLHYCKRIEGTVSTPTGKVASMEIQSRVPVLITTAIL